MLKSEKDDNIFGAQNTINFVPLYSGKLRQDFAVASSLAPHVKGVFDDFEERDSDVTDVAGVVVEGPCPALGWR